MAKIDDRCTSVRKGSAKDIYIVRRPSGSIRCIRFKFSDRVSILDIGPLPYEFPDLGKYRCAIAGKLFQVLERHGLKTHYINHDVENATMDVQPYNINELKIDYGVTANGRVLGIEVIDRRIVTERFYKRIVRKQVSASEVQKLIEGGKIYVNAPLIPPFVEATTKFEAADRYLRDYEAVFVADVDSTALANVYSLVGLASNALTDFLAPYGYTRYDGKFELAVRNDGKIVFVDSVSPDEMLIEDHFGKMYSKDLILQYFEDGFPDWCQAVKVAKNAYPDDKSKWPKYPENEPPTALIKEVVKRYWQLAQAIGAI